MILRLVLALLLLSAAVDSALAKRVALVMGNSEYTSFTPLPNPVNDARLMEKALREVGFEVTLVVNADQAQMKKAMLEFGRRLRKGVDASLFYYAGHGVQVNGENYLIPTSANIEDEDEVAIQAIDVNEFLRTMESAKSVVNIVVLDACRNNPLNVSRGGGGGLASVNAPRGSYIAYATSPGAVAEDGQGKNSPYTSALAAVLTKPGLKLEDVFKQTRKRVLDLTNENQVPWEMSSITGDFYFEGGGSPTSQTNIVDDKNIGSQLECAAAEDMKSRDNGKDVTITIRNRTRKLKIVKWIDFAGQPVEYYRLRPGESIQQQTWTSHPWIFTDLTGKCVEAMMPSATDKTFEITKSIP